MEDLDLLRSVAVFLVVVQVENRPQVLRGEDYFVIVVAQPVVEDVCNGSDEDVEDELQEADEGGEVVTD